MALTAPAPGQLNAGRRGRGTEDIREGGFIKSTSRVRAKGGRELDRKGSRVKEAKGQKD